MRARVAGTVLSLAFAAAACAPHSQRHGQAFTPAPELTPLATAQGDTEGLRSLLAQLDDANAAQLGASLSAGDVEALLRGLNDSTLTMARDGRLAALDSLLESATDTAFTNALLQQHDAALDTLSQLLQCTGPLASDTSSVRHP